MRRESGMITVDFLFALMLVMTFGAILFALSLTLTVAEITQYATFAAARSFSAAHITPDRQRDLAVAKYREILGHPQLTRLFTSGWFEVEAEADIGDITQLRPEYQEFARPQNRFIGAGTTFVARMLEFEVPFYGSTAASGDGSGSGFSTYIGSYLGREVSVMECYDFVAQRWARIRSLPSLTGAPYSTASASGYRIYDDNGC